MDQQNALAAAPTLARRTLSRMTVLAAALAAALAIGAGTLAPASDAFVPSSPAFGEQWDLLNSGQLAGTPGDDVGATRAWDIEPGGNAAVLVGFVDSGVDFAQPSLAHANLYTQASATQTSASYASACAGALYGCSFTSGVGGTPSDENGHGTATAGEVFAGWSDGEYAGLAPNSTLIVARVLGAANTGTASVEAAGLDYVADRGARVVNVSIAGSQSAAVHEAIASHPQTLFVAAAGNAGASDDGASASYPCADPSPNVICVAASDRNDRLASFSNYGASAVDLAAPGSEIPTLTREGTSSAYSGTSFAAPLVTGAAALAFAARPQATVAQVKQAILGSVQRRSELAGKTATGGRLDVAAALEALVAQLPAAPPASMRAPELSGGVAIGDTLTASAGAWSGAPATTIAWERCDGDGGHCQLISGAFGGEYRLGEEDRGHEIRAEVTAGNAAGAEIAFSAPSAPAGVVSSDGTAVGVAPSSASASGAGAAGATPAGVAGHTTAPAVARSRRAAAVCTVPGVRLSLGAARSRLLRVVLRTSARRGGHVSLRVRSGARRIERALTLATGGQRTLLLALGAGDARTAKVEVLAGGLCATKTASLHA